MAIYTGVADANGDFTVPFSSSYTSGQKITVTAEKGSAAKSIELFAPSETSGSADGAIKFSGDFTDFPNNIGIVTITDEINVLPSEAFNAEKSFFSRASGLVIQSKATIVANGCFRNWVSATSVKMSDTIVVIQSLAFYNLASCIEIHLSNQLESIDAEGITELKVPTITLPASLLSIGAYGLHGLTECNQIICLAVNPPAIQSTSFNRLKSTCLFKVPAASVAAYQAAPNWSAFASRIQAI